MVLFRWYLLFITSIVGTLLAYYNGIIERFLTVDASYMCPTILVTYLCASLYAGYLSNNPHKINEFRLDNLWYTAELLLVFGLLGTLIGFAILLPGFVNMTFTPDSITKLMGSIGESVGTSIYSSITGLIFSNIFKLQIKNLESLNAK